MLNWSQNPAGLLGSHAAPVDKLITEEIPAEGFDPVHKAMFATFAVTGVWVCTVARITFPSSLSVI
jgi:hypothetical protein